jgi:hypothetical protein
MKVEDAVFNNFFVIAHHRLYCTDVMNVRTSEMQGESPMELHELVIEMKLIERRLTLYEEKYGILSKDFYRALMAGKLERFDEYDETRTDFSRWKGIYETWRRRRQTYRLQMQQREVADALRFQPAY